MLGILGKTFPDKKWDTNFEFWGGSLSINIIVFAVGSLPCYACGDALGKLQEGAAMRWPGPNVAKLSLNIGFAKNFPRCLFSVERRLG